MVSGTNTGDKMTQKLIQFAVVREDPEIEASVIRLEKVQKVLLIASGGCTALTLKTLFPDISFTLLDINPAQIGLVQTKIQALSERQAIGFQKKFNIDSVDPQGLNQCGNFESLFRCFRKFLNEFILEESEMETIFKGDAFPGDAPQSDAILKKLITHKYWSVAFELYFSDALLVAMFGNDAIQHAAPGSYPGYFQSVLEKGLKNPSRNQNYFLHHIF